MDFISNWEQQEALERPRTIFSIGVFDGLHLGHKFLIDQVIKGAAKLKARSLILTFDPHPLMVLAPNAAPPVLTTIAQKAEILQSWGLDCLGVLHFSKEMAATPPQKFLFQFLGKFIDPVGAFLGPDFTFGQNATGNAETIAEWLATLNSKAKVGIVEAQNGLSGLHSSSQIRQDLKSGLVENAAASLGRLYQLSGQVVHGQARGRSLGFPTANLGHIKQLIPEPGVYATWATIEGQVYGAMTSIGYNPTFGEQPMTVESHIFDFNRFIYGQEISIEFVSHLRAMERFKSADQLAAQLDKDRLSALKAFGNL